jgi:hypothetical protein
MVTLPPCTSQLAESYCLCCGTATELLLERSYRGTEPATEDLSRITSLQTCHPKSLIGQYAETTGVHNAAAMVLLTMSSTSPLPFNPKTPQPAIHGVLAWCRGLSYITIFS